MLAADVEQESLLRVGEVAAAPPIRARLRAEGVEPALLEGVVPPLERRDGIRLSAVGARRAETRLRQLGERLGEIAALELATCEGADDLRAVERDRFFGVLPTNGVLHRCGPFAPFGGRGGPPSRRERRGIGPTWWAPLRRAGERRRAHAEIAAPANTRISSEVVSGKTARATSVIAARSARRRGDHPWGDERIPWNSLPSSTAPSHRRTVRHAPGRWPQTPMRAATALVAARSFP